MSERLVPAIDIGPFNRGSPDEKQAVAEKVDTACRTIGFLVVSGHGIPGRLFDDAFAAGREFFDLPDVEKRRYVPSGALEFLGYTAPLTRNLAATLGVERPPDLREIFTVGSGDAFAADFAGMPGAADLYAPNLWPEHPVAFREVYDRLYMAMEALAETMMRIFAVALELPEIYFADKIDRHFSPLGSFHYPALDRPPQPGQIAMRRPHRFRQPDDAGDGQCTGRVTDPAAGRHMGRHRGCTGRTRSQHRRYDGALNQRPLDVDASSGRRSAAGRDG